MCQELLSNFNVSFCQVVDKNVLITPPPVTDVTYTLFTNEKILKRDLNFVALSGYQKKCFPMITILGFISLIHRTEVIVNPHLSENDVD